MLLMLLIERVFDFCSIRVLGDLESVLVRVCFVMKSWFAWNLEFGSVL